METITKTVYKASNGATFLSKDECEAYDNVLTAIKNYVHLLPVISLYKKEFIFAFQDTSFEDTSTSISLKYIFPHKPSVNL